MWITALAASVGLSLGTAALAHPSDYKPTVELESRRCELYVDSLGVGQFKYLKTHQRFLDVYLRVNEHEIVELQGDEILAAGVAMTVRSFTPQLVQNQPVLDVLEFSDRVSANRISPGTWQMRFVFEERATPQIFFKEVKGISFYLDVRRGSGRIERLWIRDRGAEFTLDGIFAGGSGSTMSIGIGEIRYPDPSAPVYAQKVACEVR